jgi:hypothetical protein
MRVCSGLGNRNAFNLILYDHFTLSLKTTGKDMANIVKNKDNKCIRKEIISLLSVGEVEKLDTNYCGCITLKKARNKQKVMRVCSGLGNPHPLRRIYKSSERNF